MSDKVTGEINIANDVLAEIAGFAALECYGIAGMASPSLRDGVENLFSGDRLRRGVQISNNENGIQVDLFVVIEHGTNLTEVSHNLADRVRYVLQTMADVEVSGVEVHVQDIKVRK